MQTQAMHMQELCNGGSLQEALADGLFGCRLWPRWLPILTLLHGIASGMAYMHANLIRHGDLNPNNIFLKVRDVPSFCHPPPPPHLLRVVGSGI